MRSLFLRILLLAAALGALGGCTQPDRLDLARTRYEDVPHWAEDDHAAALSQFLKHCHAFSALPDEKEIGKGALAAPSRLWKDVCADAYRFAAEDMIQARSYFETHFTPYRASNRGKEEGLFTGYYVPLLHGSLTRGGAYQTPVYALPPEAAGGAKIYSRQEIDQGALAERGLELLWVDDPVMLFFLHIQGSGYVRLDDGRELLLSYNGKNGHPYVALGKILKDAGELSGDLNFFRIREWLYAHPDRAQAMMWRNPSYVFLKIADNAEVKGAAGVTLQPERSLATDHRFVPYGMPVYIDTALPPADFLAGMPFSRLMISGDTGGAIRGPVRGDIFFGSGPYAELRAGFQKSPGRAVYLLPNALAARLP